jgi:hypothetical protein
MGFGQSCPLGFPSSYVEVYQLIFDRDLEMNLHRRELGRDEA